MIKNHSISKVFGFGESWYCLFIKGQFCGTAHEDDKQGMDDLRNLSLAFQTI